MKYLKISAILLIALACHSAGLSEPHKTMKMRDAATHDQLSQKLRMTLQHDPIRDLGPKIGNVDVDPAIMTHSRDLVRDSTVITYRGNLTLVPKRAVLHIPDEIKDRIGAKEGMKVLTWRDFFQMNRGWIRTVEVSREQVMGESPLPAGIVEAYKKSSSMVVATFKGGAVSVLPVKTPELPVEEESELQSATR